MHWASATPEASLISLLALLNPLLLLLDLVELFGNRPMLLDFTVAVVTCTLLSPKPLTFGICRTLKEAVCLINNVLKIIVTFLKLLLPLVAGMADFPRLLLFNLGEADLVRGSEAGIFGSIDCCWGRPVDEILLGFVSDPIRELPLMVAFVIPHFTLTDFESAQGKQTFVDITAVGRPSESFHLLAF